MKKFNLCFFIFFCFTIPLFAQLKEYIPIVKPVLYEKTKETFENIAKKFEEKNYNDLAEVFRSFAMGGHGSGFVFVDSDGENYIITNRHVVANSEYVNLEFVGKGSTKILYESCPIIYTDDKIDLAIVKFPNNEKVFEKSFPITKEKQSDGNEIWSAGFPGLLGKPAWQFSKGNITNEEAYVDQLVASDVSYLIQHSASIDPGNSGGPLLVKMSDADEYSVIGINTWTITNRQNTFFSIPSKNIPGLIANAKNIVEIKSNKDSLRNLLEKQARIFVAELSSDKPTWERVMGSISYAFTGNKGWESFIRMLAEGDSETLKLIEDKFFAYSPIEAMRYAILFRIWNKVNKKNDKQSGIEYKGISIADEEQITKGKEVRTRYLINGEEQEIEWTFEHGHWRISNYDFDKYVDNNSTGIKRTERKRPCDLNVDAFYVPHAFLASSTLNKKFNPMGFSASFTFLFKERIGVFLRGNSLSFNNKMKDPMPSYLTEASIKYFILSAGAILYFGKGKFRPYALAAFGNIKYTESGKYKTYSKAFTYKNTGSHLGVGVKYPVTNRLGINAEASYYWEGFNPILFDFDLRRGKKNTSNLQVSLGINLILKRNISLKKLWPNAY